MPSMAADFVRAPQCGRARARRSTTPWLGSAACSAQLGFDDLALYDGSMGEWAKDRTLPIETG